MIEIITTDKDYKTCVMTYRSVDPQGRKIWLSGRLYFSVDENGDAVMPTHILMACHHTIGENSLAPSSLIGIESAMATNGGLVVAPDYLGFGITKDLDHPYCVPEQTARNVTDMMLAAKEYFNDLGMPLDNIPVYCEGYSQGGQAALAVVKYTQEHPGRLPKLKNTMCGGGPYSIDSLMRFWFKPENGCSYPCGVIYSMIGLKTGFPEIMKAPLEDYFSEEALAAGVIDIARGKETGTEDFNDVIFDFAGDITGTSADMTEILSEGASSGDGELYRQISEACRRCELSKGWRITGPVHFLHSDEDDVVDYLNFELAKDNLKNRYTTFETLDGLPGHIANAVIFYARVACGEYLK